MINVFSYVLSVNRNKNILDHVSKTLMFKLF